MSVSYDGRSSISKANQERIDWYVSNPHLGHLEYQNAGKNSGEMVPEKGLKEFAGEAPVE